MVIIWAYHTAKYIEKLAIDDTDSGLNSQVFVKKARPYFQSSDDDFKQAILKASNTTIALARELEKCLKDAGYTGSYHIAA